MRWDSQVVTPAHIAKDGPKKGCCVYCGEPIGTEHKKGFVCRKRTVVITATFTLIDTVPEDWDPEMVEFHLNGSSYCADNILDTLNKLTEAHCTCGQFEGRYVREATAEDVEFLGAAINPEQST